jgi:hypothetical protein
MAKLKERGAEKNLKLKEIKLKLKKAKPILNSQMMIAKRNLKLKKYQSGLIK